MLERNSTPARTSVAYVYIGDQGPALVKLAKIIKPLIVKNYFLTIGHLQYYSFHHWAYFNPVIVYLNRLGILIIL